jgi:hypothetical protein
MKKIKITILILLTTIITYNTNAQELVTKSVGEVVYENFLKTEKISTDGKGGFVFEFQDDQYQYIEVTRKVKFDNKKQILNFFETLEKVAYAPKSKKTDDIEVDMTEYVTYDGKIYFNRLGKKQFVVNILADNGILIIPIKRTKKLVKIVNSL